MHEGYKMLLSTPLQDVLKQSLYAVSNGSDLVSIYLVDGDIFLDSFTLDEYCELLSDGVLDKETRKLTINW